MFVSNWYSPFTGKWCAHPPLMLLIYCSLSRWCCSHLYANARPPGDRFSGFSRALSRVGSPPPFPPSLPPPGLAFPLPSYCWGNSLYYSAFCLFVYLFLPLQYSLLFYLLLSFLRFFVSRIFLSISPSTFPSIFLTNSAKLNPQIIYIYHLLLITIVYKRLPWFCPYSDTV